MKFRRVDPDAHHPVLRLASESGRWNIGLWRGSDGLRLRMGLAGRRPDVIDLCLGPDPAIYPHVVIAVVTVVESLPESASAAEIDSAFPWHGTRPDLAIHLPALEAQAASHYAGTALTPSSLPRSESTHAAWLLKISNEPAVRHHEFGP